MLAFIAFACSIRRTAQPLRTQDTRRAASSGREKAGTNCRSRRSSNSWGSNQTDLRSRLGIRPRRDRRRFQACLRRSALADERGITTVGFLERALAWYRAHGIRVQRCLSDNGANYRSHVFQAVLFAPISPDDLHAALPSSNQRQGGALHPNTDPRVGLRSPLHTFTLQNPGACSPGCATTISAVHTGALMENHQSARLRMAREQRL